MAAVLHIESVRECLASRGAACRLTTGAPVLAGRGMVPSTLDPCLDLMRSCSIKHRMASVMFLAGDEQVPRS